MEAVGDEAETRNETDGGEVDDDSRSWTRAWASGTTGRGCWSRRPWILVKLEDLLRERAEDSYDWDGGDLNSPLSMWLQLGREWSGVSLRCWRFGHFARVPNTRDAKARERERRLVKAAWISGSRAKVSLSREDGVGMGSLGLLIPDVGRATR